MRSRLLVTGCGLVTALGTNAGETWTRLISGERAIGPVDLFDTTDYRSRVGAQVRGTLRTDADRDPSWSRTTAMALTAAHEAIASAGLTPRLLGSRCGLVVAGTVGGMHETEALLAGFYADTNSREVLAQMLSHPLTATGDRLERELGPFARVRTISSACSGGANALLIAAIWLLSGEVDVVLAGAADALCRLTFSGFNALAALDPEPCRPFDASRRGLSLGEGAGFVVLERDESASLRGATSIAELCGWAIGSEAHHITNPEASGATPARLLVEALRRARLEPRQIGYVNAHGTGTPLNDAMEARAIGETFGGDVLVSSSKGQIGHTLGAAGAIEAVITAFAVKHKVAPPTGGLEKPDAACALRHVMGQGQTHCVRAAVSSSFGFGGMDTVLVFAEPGHAPLGAAPHRRHVVVTGAAEITPALPATRIEADRARDLDPVRARRLDRSARLGTIVACSALRESGAGVAKERVGIVLGSAFGSVDGSSAYMHRLFEKGPRLSSPMDFPNLVPSSPVGHASIYNGLRGPVLSVADLSASGEAAIAQALELVASGEADLMVAGAVEEASDIVERVLVALFTRERAGRPLRSEGAAAVVLEAEAIARARGASILVRVEQLVAWRVEPNVAAVRPPRAAARARVVAPFADARLEMLLASTPWHGCSRIGVAEAAGDHEALGAVAASVGTRLVARGDADEALVVCCEEKRGSALLLVRP